MNRIDRLTAILLQLQTKRILPGKEIAEHFGISLCTVYRDIRTLEDAGVPIGSEAGVGYFLAPGYHLPPVMFTDQEARALLLVGKLIDKFSDAERHACRPRISRTWGVLCDRRSPGSVDFYGFLWILTGCIVAGRFLRTDGPAGLPFGAVAWGKHAMEGGSQARSAPLHGLHSTGIDRVVAPNSSLAPGCQKNRIENPGVFNYCRFPPFGAMLCHRPAFFS